MTNNDILRRLRYTFDFHDALMIDIFALTDFKVTRSEISNWLKKDDDPLFKELSDKQLAIFLNGLIIYKRGKTDGPAPIPEDVLTNNLIFRKLKIALNLIDEDIIEILVIAEMRISKHELSAFFRNPKHGKYRPCQNQILRKFLKGLQIKYRGSAPFTSL